MYTFDTHPPPSTSAPSTTTTNPLLIIYLDHIVVTSIYVSASNKLIKPAKYFSWLRNIIIAHHPGVDRLLLYAVVVVALQGRAAKSIVHKIYTKINTLALASTQKNALRPLSPNVPRVAHVYLVGMYGL